MKKYFDVKGSETNKISVTLDYDLGGCSVLSGNFSARGYYLFVFPVKREKRNGGFIESMELFKGSKILLVGVARQSKKALAEAEKLAEQKILEMAHKTAAAEGWELDLPEETV